MVRVFAFRLSRAPGRGSSCKTLREGSLSSKMAVSVNWGSFLGGLAINTLFFGVYIRPSDFWKLPYDPCDAQAYDIGYLGMG